MIDVLALQNQIKAEPEVLQEVMDWMISTQLNGRNSKRDGFLCDRLEALTTQVAMYPRNLPEESA